MNKSEKFPQRIHHDARLDKKDNPSLETLSEQILKYRVLVENLQEGLFIIDPDLNFIYANPALCRIFDYSFEEVIGHNVCEFVPEIAFQKILAEISKRKKGLSSRYELSVKRRDGALRNTFLSAAPWINSDGKFLGAIGVVFDDTDRKKTEDALRQSEELFRTIIDASKDAMITIDRQGLIILFNPAAEEMFGYYKEKMLNQPLDCLLPEEFRLIHRQYIENYFSTGEPHNAIGQTIEQSALHRTGHVVPIELSLSLGKAGEQEFVLAVIRDITDRKRMEGEIQALSEARIVAERKQNEAAQLAAQASQLASIGVIAAGITHEINQPLSAIQMHANTLLYLVEERKYVLPEPFNKIFREISEGSKRINSIIQHMRSFWLSPNSEPIKNVDVNDAIKSALTLTNRKALSHSIRIKLDLSPQPLIIHANKLQIEQIVINLIINAIQSLDQKSLSQKEIVISTSSSDKISILKVQDNGIGLPAVKSEDLFNPFFSTKKPGEGMGLGLAIVKMFVDRFNGEIEAENNVEGGATFSIHFPIAEINKSK